MATVLPFCHVESHTLGGGGRVAADKTGIDP